MSTEARSDENLMQAYAAGAESAFGELYRRYEQRLYAFLERRLPPGRKHFASDLFQKTWLLVHHGRHRFDPSQGFAPWFFTIALNALRDHVGRASFRLDVDTDPAEVQIASGEDLEANLLIKERVEVAEELLGALPAAQREILLLSEWDGLSAREIGAVFEMTENAARQALFRAKRRLKELLATREGGQIR